MTIYHVHIYRELKLYFPGIEADTPEEAAAKASDMDTADADEIASCDGENLGALVDVMGDEDFSRSVTIDFEPERLRKAAATLRQALAWVGTAAGDLDAAIDGVTDRFDSERVELHSACCNARQVLAEFTDEPAHQPHAKD
jgi:hypothetical protein